MKGQVDHRVSGHCECVRPGSDLEMCRRDHSSKRLCAPGSLCSVVLRPSPGQRFLSQIPEMPWHAHAGRRRLWCLSRGLRRRPGSPWILTPPSASTTTSASSACSKVRCGRANESEPSPALAQCAASGPAFCEGRGTASTRPSPLCPPGSESSTSTSAAVVPTCWLLPQRGARRLGGPSWVPGPR